MVDESTSERARKEISREERRGQWLAFCPYVVDARRGRYLRRECITRDVQHGKFAGNTVRWPSTRRRHRRDNGGGGVGAIRSRCRCLRAEQDEYFVGDEGLRTNALNTSLHKLFTKRIHLQKNILQFLRSVCVLRGKCFYERLLENFCLVLLRREYEKVRLIFIYIYISYQIIHKIYRLSNKKY